MSTILTFPRTNRVRRGSAKSYVGQALATWRERRALAELDPHILRDIGLSEEEVHREARRPIWDVPGYWRL